MAVFYNRFPGIRGSFIPLPINASTMFRYLPIRCLLFCLFICYSVQGQQSLRSVEFLLGTWKIENRDTFESWKDSGSATFTGESYKILDNHKKVLETLTLIVDKGAIVYLATVPNQNEGQTIPFTLNTLNKDCYSFENPEHDFPKKIQYGVLSADTLSVNIIGEGGQGFSYRLIRQNNAGN